MHHAMEVAGAAEVQARRPQATAVMAHTAEGVAAVPMAEVMEATAALGEEAAPAGLVSLEEPPVAMEALVVVAVSVRTAR